MTAELVRDELFLNELSSRNIRARQPKYRLPGREGGSAKRDSTADAKNRSRR
jgi:hypothetical protein